MTRRDFFCVSQFDTSKYRSKAKMPFSLICHLWISARFTHLSFQFFMLTCFCLLYLRPLSSFFHLFSALIMSRAEMKQIQCGWVKHTKQIQVLCFLLIYSKLNSEIPQFDILSDSLFFRSLLNGVWVFPSQIQRHNSRKIWCPVTSLTWSSQPSLICSEKTKNFP